MGPDYEHLKGPLDDSNMQPEWHAGFVPCSPSVPLPLVLFPACSRSSCSQFFPHMAWSLAPFLSPLPGLFSSPLVSPLLLTFQVSFGFKIQIGVIFSKKTSLIIDYTTCPALWNVLHNVPLLSHL